MRVSLNSKYTTCLLSVLVVILLTIGCEKEPILDIRDGIEFNPDTVQVNPALKAWELYSWQSGEEWRFSLIAGTNRTKSIEEILSNPYALTGREQFKLLLRQLPSGDSIQWRGPEWVQDSVKGVVKMIALPGILDQYDIYSFCERKNLGLEIIP